MFTWRRIQLEGKITGQFIYIILLSMFLILFTSLLALNVSRDFLGVFVKHANNETLKNNYLLNKNKSLFIDITNSGDTLNIKTKAENIKQEADQICDYIKDIQVELICNTEEVNKTKSLELLENIGNITKKDNADKVYRKKKY